MCSLLQEAVRRGELREDTPIRDLALMINGQLYGLMTIWCMSDGAARRGFCKPNECRRKPYAWREANSLSGALTGMFHA